jgi:hypothetical protein
VLVQGSNCNRIFGYSDFDQARVGTVPFEDCPVRGCLPKTVVVPYGKRIDRHGNLKTRPWCSEHGIRIHSGTFVYWNGLGTENRSRLCNFIVRQDLVEEIALAVGAKAESHRLGYEMSEDALSWNVFVSLAVARKLKDAAYFLTGRTLTTEPDLYLWGKRVDTRAVARVGGSSLCGMSEHSSNHVFTHLIRNLTPCLSWRARW